MWPIVLAILRRNAVYITLPIAGVIGFIGYNLESLISDKYTPYSPSIQDLRAQRQAQSLMDSTSNVDKLSVLERNLSPSLQPKAKV